LLTKAEDCKDLLTKVNIGSHRRSRDAALANLPRIAMLKQPAIASQAGGRVPSKEIALGVGSANVLTRTFPHIM